MTGVELTIPRMLLLLLRYPPGRNRKPWTRPCGTPTWSQQAQIRARALVAASTVGVKEDRSAFNRGRIDLMRQVRTFSSSRALKSSSTSLDFSPPPREAKWKTIEASSGVK